MSDIKTRLKKLEEEIEKKQPSKHKHWWINREDPKTGKAVNFDGTPWVKPCDCGMGTTVTLTRHP